MPYKFEYDGSVIPRHLRRTVKLSPEERVQIKELYGKISQRKLAKMYNVSRRLVIFIGCPEKMAQNKVIRKINNSNGEYYNKEKQKIYMRTHRNYKKLLAKSNLLNRNIFKQTEFPLRRGRTK